MTVELTKKESYIELFRENEFNCFPIKANTKVADYRFKGQGKTARNQPITKSENYAILPTKEGKNAILDLDNKEEYRPFALRTIKAGYMVIESPHGWHIPIINLGNYATKIELYNYKIQPKKIIEIQGWLHYCVGVGSQIIDEDSGEIIKYVNRGSDKIWDAQGKFFDEFVNAICKQCEVESVKLENSGSRKHLRDQFRDGKVPTEGQSNNYFHQASRFCITEGITIDEAKDKIKIVYDKWKESKYYSHRPWSNVEAKINEVYDDPDKFIITKGRKKDSGQELDRTEIAKDFIKEREVYSNPKTHEVFENENGFLELLNFVLKKELQPEYGVMEKADYDSILFKMEGLAEDIPPTNKDLIVFKNGVFDITKHELIETNEIADMGFRKYNYLPKTKANEPTEFLKFFKSYKPHEHPRLKIALRSIFSGHQDSRISVLIGLSRVGKTTMLSIVCKIIGDDYALSVELEKFLEDRATQAKMNGKRVVVFQDLSDNWNDFAKLKAKTGESSLMIRGFGVDGKQNPNKVKFFATGNMIPAIKDSQKDSMYADRLSLIHNIETKKFENDPRMEDRIIEAEAEKIISWIVNLTDKECEYEDSATVRLEWEKSANPEVEWLKKKYEPTTSFDDRMVVIQLIEKFYQEENKQRDIDQFNISLKRLGYAVYNGVIKNIIPRTTPTMKAIDN